MAENENKIVQPGIKRAPGRHRGPLSSEDYNNFQDQAYSDIISLGNACNALANKLQRALRTVESENLQLKRRLEGIEQRFAYKEFIQGKTAVKIDRYIDFHNTQSIMFPTNLPDSKRAEFKSQFGEIYLPANGIENKFFTFSLKNGSIVLPSDFNVDASGSFDKVDGNGIRDYEYGGEVNAGEPRNAFNGINESAWIRTVTFPLESTVEEVEVQLIAVVPAGISSQANLIELVPYPDGAVDVTQVATSPDLSSAFVLIDNFVESNNTPASRYHFSPREVEQVRVRLRCRNWREVNGKKVFMYGLQELGLKLVDYNKLDTADESFGQGITSVIKIDAPTGHIFSSLYRIDTYPNFFLEDSGSRHIRLRLSTTPDFSNVKWDSSQNVLPQQGISTGVAIGGASTLYAIYTLTFVDSSGGFQAPFPVGTTPTIKGLGLLFSANQTNNL